MTWSVAVGGASGLVGRALQSHVSESFPDVRWIRLVRDRSQTGPDAIYWSPQSSEIDRDALEGVHAVINLAGEPIGPARWSEERMRRIRESRIRGTELLARTIATLDRPPNVFIHASAVGFYGDTGDAVVDEGSPGGEGFLATVCKEWEQASNAAESAGVRVVRLRLGHVLSADGGLLGAMETPFKLGLGGRFGSGRQFWSWIAMPDLVGIILEAVHDEKMRGVINAVTPYPVRNRDFAKRYASALGRPAVLPAPAPALKLVFGSLQAREMLLFGQRVRPRVLEELGFDFRYPELDETLRAIVGGGLQPRGMQEA
ncbi:MAG: TIGR01777 family oxidoreductase [Polyangiales bacterium]